MALDTTVTIISESDRLISGYVMLWGNPGVNVPTFDQRTRVDFDIASSIPVLWCHTHGLRIGTVLQLRRNGQGLHIVAQLADSRILAPIARGLIGWSAGFSLKVNIGKKNGQPYIKRGELAECSLSFCAACRPADATLNKRGELAAVYSLPALPKPDKVEKLSDRCCLWR